jgi:hypothetical protein
MNVIGMTLQFVLAIIVVYVMNSIAGRVMKDNAIIVDYSRNVSTPIIKGWVAGTSFTNKTFNAFNPFARNYRDMPKSVNKHGGITFSWSVWTRFDDVSKISLKNKVLFMYGDNQKYSLAELVNNVQKEVITDYVIKCPLVKFDDDGEGLKVQFNTNEHIHNEVDIQRVKNLDESKRSNILAMMPNRWTLWTFVFNDNVPFGESLPSGIEVKMYVNDFLHHTERVPKGSLRMNKGYVTILPEPINGSYLGDLIYHNFALQPEQVRRLLDRGVPKQSYAELTQQDFNMPNHITEYNKLEIYNV